MAFNNDDDLLKQYVELIAEREAEENPQGVLDRIRRELSDYAGHPICSNQQLFNEITILIDALESKEGLMEKDEITSQFLNKTDLIRVFQKGGMIYVVSSMIHLKKHLYEIHRLPDEIFKNHVGFMIYEVACKLAINAIETIQQLTCKENVALEGLSDDTIVANGKTLYELSRMKIEYEHMNRFKQ